MMRSVGLALAAACFLASCAATPMVVKAPRVAVETPKKQTVEADVGGSKGSEASEFERPPIIQTIESMPRDIPLPPKSDSSSRFSSKDKLTVTVDGMPMRNFLNYVFGELLKANFVIAEGGPALDQVVTLNTQQAVSSRQLYRLTTELLAEKGLKVSEKEGVLLIGPVTGKGADNVAIGFGRNASDVPDVAGKILQIVPWRFGQNISVERVVRDLADVTAQPADQQNALFITGTRANILRALELFRMLDQPVARSSRIGLISLTYLDSKEFIAQVSTLLENDGIPAGEGRAEGKGVAFVSLERLGSIAVFAPTSEILSRVEFWAKQIDRPSRGPTLRYFLYQPKFARASDLVESLAPLVGGPQNVQGNQARDTRTAMTPTPTSQTFGSSQMAAEQYSGPVSVQGEGITISADRRSNSLVVYTTGIRYENLLPTIRRLDVPPKQILLEATIAEVSLSGEFANGVEFLFKSGKLSGGTGGGLGLPSGGLGLSYVANLTDSAKLRLTASDSKINILSNPILVVRDGMQASIAVGNDVPTLGASISNPLQTNNTVLNVVYRQTGIKLGIKPTINAQGSVLMTIQQDISNSVPGASGVAGAPTFFTRTVQTEVVAQSGQSVLLAGLISDSGSNSTSGVPILSRIPLVGLAFRSDSKKREKTELVLLITPKIIEGPEQLEEVKKNLEPALDYLSISGPQGTDHSTKR